jgi:hypothetical protein
MYLSCNKKVLSALVSELYPEEAANVDAATTDHLADRLTQQDVIDCEHPQLIVDRWKKLLTDRESLSHSLLHKQRTMRLSDIHRSY